MLRESVLLKVGTLFEYVDDVLGDEDNGVYRVTKIKECFDYNVATAELIDGGNLIYLYCDNDGHYYGGRTIHKLDVIKPIKNIKEFKLC